MVNGDQMDTTMPGRYNTVQDTMTKNDLKVDGFDIVKKQQNDEILLDLKIRLQKGDVTSANYSRHVILDNTLYYIFNVNIKSTLRT